MNVMLCVNTVVFLHRNILDECMQHVSTDTQKNKCSPFFLKMETLEHLVELTKNVFECDRDEMYYYLLQLCGKLSCNFYHVPVCLVLCLEIGNSLELER